MGDRGAHGSDCGGDITPWHHGKGAKAQSAAGDNSLSDLWLRPLWRRTTGRLPLLLFPEIRFQKSLKRSKKCGIILV